VSKALIIPPCPTVLIELQNLLKTQEPDINYLIKVIKRDLALYTILLSAANSPIYRRSQAIKSIEQAIIILGTEKLATLIQTVILRSELDQAAIPEEFWSSCTEVASICSVIAEQFILVDSELAYKVGMLHATGMAVMMRNFSHYSLFVKKNNNLDAKKLCYLERETFGTDHYHQGYELTKTWNMDENAALAVRYQPITLAVLKDPKHLPPEVPTLLALLKLAKYISNEYRLYWKMTEQQSELKQLDSILDHLDISQDDFQDLRDQLSDQLLQNAAA